MTKAADSPLQRANAAAEATPLSLRGVLALAALVAAPRLLFVMLAPSFAGDGRIYARVAENILQHGCVSLSDPLSAACAPHWGGNQLPGYPLFIAVGWLLTDHWALAPFVAQALAFAAAAAYLVRALGDAGAGRRAQILVGTVLALSPTLVAWPRFLLTESLSAAATLWMLAVIVRSLAERRLRVLEIGVVLAAAVFVRYSLAALALPVLFAAVDLHGGRVGVRRATAALLIAAVRLTAWTARSVAAGLPFPPAILTDAGTPVSGGVLRWMKTWVRSQYDLPVSVWPLLTGDLASIAPPQHMRTLPAEAWRGSRFLDVGCGMGRNSYWACKFGAAGGVAIDIDDATLAAARNTLASCPQVEARKISAYQIELDEHFDIVFSIGVVHHLESPADPLREMVRLTRPGGRVLIWVYGAERSRWLLRFLDPLRRALFSRVPVQVVHALSLLPAAVLWGLLRVRGATLGVLRTHAAVLVRTCALDRVRPDAAAHCALLERRRSPRAHDRRRPRRRPNQVRERRLMVCRRHEVSGWMMAVGSAIRRARSMCSCPELEVCSRDGKALAMRTSRSPR